MWWLLLAWAQDPPPADTPAEAVPPEQVTPRPDDSDMWQAWRGDQPITARRLAEEKLAQAPDDLSARMVLGAVLAEEGDLPAAAWHLGKVVDGFEAQVDRSAREAWLPHAHALLELADVLRQMDDPQGALDVMDAHDEAYSPKVDIGRAWPLLQMKRYEAARAIASLLVDADDLEDQHRALNSICAIDAELGHREEAWVSCQAVYNHALTNGLDLAVPASNTFGSALAVLRFAEAEKIALMGRYSSGGQVSNPWANLAWLHLSQGRGAEAIDDVRRMQAWRAAQPPLMHDQNRAESESQLADLLLVAGEADKGVEVIERALIQPDRHGFSSGNAEETRASHVLLHLALRRSQWERARERAAAASLPWRLLTALRSWLPDPEARADAAIIRGVLADATLLRGLMRPYLFEGLPATPPWLTGDVIAVIGVGVARSAVSLARQADPEPAYAPYFDALDAEIAWRSGDADASMLGAAAHNALPESEALLRARVAAIVADASWSAGARDAAAWYERAMRADPGVFRRLGLGVPAQVTGSTEVADILRRSPRLVMADGVLRVDVGPTRVCTYGPTGNRLSCVSLSDAEDGSAEALADAWHRLTFRMPMNLSRYDLDSLDGITVARDAEAARQSKKALDELTEEGR